jgi:hypothetical protein
VTEKVALSILDREGSAAISKLPGRSAEANRTGHPHSAEVILEMAGAAEAAWLAPGERLCGCLVDVIASPG